MYMYLNFMILQPFRRLEKYPGLLKELQRHLAVSGVSYIHSSKDIDFIVSLSLSRRVMLTVIMFLQLLIPTMPFQ